MLAFFSFFYGKSRYFCAQIVDLSAYLSILILFMCGIDNIVGSDFCRFDVCGISPLTVKALSSAGYVQMTRVQEATLGVCLEGTYGFNLKH